MTKLFAVTYIAATSGDWPSISAALSAGTEITSTIDFPFDIGDDPSFRSAMALGGAITWGVCRPDVRGQLKKKDWVAFFSAEKFGAETVYKFVAALEVEIVMAQTELWSCNGEPYKNYKNLLIRPSGSGWEHYEPGLAPKAWHNDWLWRICNRQGLQKKEVTQKSQSHTPGQALTNIAKNYVIFDSHTAILPPLRPVVAVYKSGDAKGAETWNDDAYSTGIREAIFGAETERGLRINNRQPHRHFKRCLEDPVIWSKHLRELTDDWPGNTNF